MTNKRKNRKTLEIESFILNNVSIHPHDISSITSTHFNISKASVSRHLKNLIEDKKIKASGSTHKRSFSLVWELIKEWEFDLEKISEHTAWQQNVGSFFDSAPDNVREICEYGFTEMFNNAIDHSEGKKVKVFLYGSIISFLLTIEDDGIGIFNKIASACELDDPRHAVLELSKGKLTTDPDNHSGEGIFFTSRCFEQFSILSGGVHFNHNERINDEHWVFESEHTGSGTSVFMEMDWDCKRKIEDIFQEYAAEEHDYAFNKTIVPVNLVRVGKENLVSRSQAKRLLARIDQFHTVILDFKGVDKIGQGFADEVFRVFKNKHPEVDMKMINVRLGVRRMIRRIRSQLEPGNL